jgi:tetratricopeptide (TPR) repeat protein
VLKEPAAAAAKFEQAVEANPNHAYAYARWGDALAAQGDREGAVVKYRIASKLGEVLVFVEERIKGLEKGIDGPDSAQESQ